MYMRQSLDWLEKALDEEIITKIGNQFEQHVRSEYYGISDADSEDDPLDEEALTPIHFAAIWIFFLVVCVVALVACLMEPPPSDRPWSESEEPRSTTTVVAAADAGPKGENYVRLG